MSNVERIATTRRIAAPAGAIFALIADPRGHVRIDGSGMLVEVGCGGRLGAVGDVFEMEMERPALDDRPAVPYRVRCQVTRFAADAELEWTVGGVDRPPIGHVYGYRLESAGPDQTDVTSYCDWSGAEPGWKARAPWPIVPLASLEHSLANLERVVLADR